MGTRSQNKPPLSSAPPSSPSNRKDNIDEIPIDKRRRVGSGKMVGPANSGRTRQAFSVVNAGQDLATAGDPASTASSECGGIEFTLEDVEAILNEKMKGKTKFDYKGKCEQMTEYVKKLRLCLKWFLEREDNHVLEHEKLKNMVESTEKERTELEMQMKSKEEESNSIIAELRKNYASLEAKCTKEEADKLAAINSHRREKDARVSAESAQASLSNELKKTREELSSANQKISAVNEMYKRLQEYNTSLQQYNSKLQTEVASAYSRASQEEAIKQKEALVNEVGSLRGELQQVRDDRDRQLLQVQTLSVEVVKYQESTGKSSAELDNMMIKSSALEDTCSSQRDQIQILQHQLAAANEKLQRVDMSALQTRTEFEEQKKMVEDLNNRLADAELQIIEADKLRKKLHNTILELKGNIRVFCRVRPFLPEDGARSDMAVISYPTSTEALGRGIDVVQNGQKHPFTFDQVFTHEASQQDVFVEISQLVQSALDGYKVCIFAYGQTGSGKTYTMMGNPEAAEQKGLIPQSLEQIFQISQSLISQGWRYKMQASMLEIYNETIRDLLSTNRSNGPDISRADNGVAGKQYAIKHDANGNTYVSDLTIVDVCSITEISSLLRQAAQNRSVGKTQMNEQSSRSHFVFTLRISGVNESTEQQVQGVLNLIDLAGSERLSKSGSTGDRLKETQAINLSLKCLSDVIFSLAKKEDHIPFRNSKLTYLLQPCLGGDSKTLMFVNISPSPSSVGESLCSLRFAARVNACEIGIPRRQTNMRPLDSRLSYG
ncbi:kinesin-like protein KIN-14C isoform X2 [Telopea speciosissima]|uniref:kinesin-like protein KIN-14C isoform X2 n=1 Tax=Telopea speciosissima TaxID=54955 RepID=UPI001CC54C63|nr:kinesin-like protein KIN-14C isoform X2 [Telopea speciosissima]